MAMLIDNKRVKRQFGEVLYIDLMLEKAYRQL